MTMPPHQRAAPQGASEARPSVPQGQPQNIFSRINEDIKALNTSLQLATQKINSMVRYEKILGRNLVVLNKKVKVLQDSKQGPGEQVPQISSELAEISKRLNSNAEAIARLQSDVEYIKENYAKSEQVSEIKYVVDSINPMEFVTLKDVQNLVPQKKNKN